MHLSSLFWIHPDLRVREFEVEHLSKICLFPRGHFGVADKVQAWVLSAWLRFRYRKWAHLRREMGAAPVARAARFA